MEREDIRYQDAGRGHLPELDDITRRKIRKVLEHPKDFGEVREIPIDALRSDTTYQRAISQHWVSTIVHRFDPRLFGVVIVGARGGNLNLVDGQHRHVVAQVLRDMGGKKTMTALVFPTSSLQEEARLFVELNSNRRKPMGQQLFAAKLIARDSTAMTINDLVSKYKFKFRDPNVFNMGAAPDTITAIKELEVLFRIGGETLLMRTLRALRVAWDGDEVSLGRMMVGSVGRFFMKYPDETPGSVGKAWSQQEAYTVIEQGKRVAYRSRTTKHPISDMDGVIRVLERLSE